MCDRREALMVLVTGPGRDGTGSYGDSRGEVDTIVTTQYGAVRGQAFPVYNGRFAETILAWHAIPFAEPPTGPLRFAPPVEVTPWEGVRDALELGDVCEQILMLQVYGSHPGWDKMSEDCLTLDVFTPYDTSGGPFPVMVFIHGGGFQYGGSIQNPGHFLATYGVVVVIIQYRLNNFGYLYTGDDAVTPNVGLLDQQMALQWIQNTIADFGGDPDHVTIFGQSAGAASVGLHMVSPSSQGLFHQVMLESGNDMVEWAIIHPDSPPEEYARQLGEAKDCPTNDSHAMVTCLRTKTPRQIRIFAPRSVNGYDCLGMVPVIDGPGGFLPDWPRVLRETGQVSPVPVLHGINKDESAIFNIGYVSNITYPEGLDRANFTQYLDTILSGLRGNLIDSEYDTMFRMFDYVYAPWPDVNDKMKNLDALNELSTDIGFGMAWDYMSKLHQKIAPVYNYIFNYRSENTRLPEWRGVPHAAELPYIFGMPLLQINPNVQQDSELVVAVNYTVEDIQMTAYFQELVTNFAKFGNPTPEPVVNPNGHGSTVWPRYTWDDMNYLKIQNPPYTDTQWRQKQYALTQYLLPSTLGVYFDTSNKEDGHLPGPGSPP